MGKKQDRKLLELAATAAGFIWNPTIATDGVTLAGCYADADDQVADYWNPLFHTSDAFELAMRLGIQMHPYIQTNPPLAVAAMDNGVGFDYFGERPSKKITMAQAMCRAITRAAAQIQLDKEKNK